MKAVCKNAAAMKSDIQPFLYARLISRETFSILFLFILWRFPKTYKCLMGK